MGLVEIEGRDDLIFIDASNSAFGRIFRRAQRIELQRRNLDAEYLEDAHGLRRPDARACRKTMINACAVGSFNQQTPLVCPITANHLFRAAACVAWVFAPRVAN